MKLKPIIYGAIGGIIVWTAAFFLAALILYLTGAGDFFITVSVKIIIALSALTGGFVAGKMCNTKRFLWGLATGLILFFLSVVLGTFLGENGSFTADEAINFVLFSVFSLAGGMLS
ncbi:MAG: TIGR04086 family membrane protein [Lachnospiraceae bacterium]